MSTLRHNSIGLAGRSPGNSNTAQRGAQTTSDPFLKQFVIPLPVVASGAEQDTGFAMPLIASAVSGFVRVKTASSGGAAQTISIGTVGSATSLLNAGDLSAAGIIPTTGADLGGGNISYTLGGADVVGFDAELVLTVLGSDI